MKEVIEIGTAKIALKTGLSVQMIRWKARKNQIKGRINCGTPTNAPGKGYKFDWNDPKFQEWLVRNTVGDGEPVKPGRKPRAAYKRTSNDTRLIIIRDFQTFTGMLREDCATWARRISRAESHLNNEQREALAKAIKPLLKIQRKVAEKLPNKKYDEIFLS